ncbi:PD40 domain-containing protein [bacterium]|nr:PD40 domain-containing protein [bacterium]
MINKKISFLIIFIFFACHVFPQLVFPPNQKWKTIETRHFFIHYPELHIELACRIASLSEDVHETILPVLRHVPSEKTHIVINDFYDSVFGAASFIFYNAIYISPNQIPAGLGHYEDFLSLLLLHEYCHILDMDMIGGFPEGARHLFGRFYSPNWACPLWMIEGFAVYIETELSEGGRGIDPYYDMYLRMAFLKNQVPKLDQVTPVLDRWPGPASPYVYGESLYRYMTGKRGPDKAVSFRRENSRKLWPFSFGGSLGYYWGGSISRFYSQWKSGLAERYERQKNYLESRGISQVQRLTNLGGDTWGIEWMGGDDEILFFNRTYDEHALIRSVNTENQSIRNLKKVNCVYPQLSLNQTGDRIYFSQFEIYDKNALYSDIYYLDRRLRRVCQVTKKQRTFDPDINKEGDIVYIRTHQGKTDLCLQKQNGDCIVLLKGDESHYYSNPGFSPDSKQIVLSVWEQGGFKDIVIYQIDSRNYYSICHDKAWDITPSWTRDGKGILFASDRTGVYNIFHYSLQNKKMARLTNLLGGAFCPKVSHDSRKLAFIGYSSKGFDVYTMDMPSAETLESLSDFDHDRREDFSYGYQDPPKNHKKESLSFRAKGPLFKSKNYNPLRTLARPVRFPVLTMDDTSTVVGAAFIGKDVLNQHFYGLIGAYSIDRNRFQFMFDYLNMQYYPNVSVYIQDFVEPHDLSDIDEGSEDDLYWQRLQMASLSFEVPVSKLEYNFSISPGISYEKYTNANMKPLNQSRHYFQGKLNSLFIRANYSSVRAYTRSISYEEGMHINAEFSKYSQSLSSKLDFFLGKVSIQNYFPMIYNRHHVLFTKLNCYYTDMKKESRHLSLFSFRVRGYQEQSWRKYFYGGSVEYRYPLFNIERGYKVWPVYLRQIHGAVFTDYSEYSNINFSRKTAASSGIELKSDFWIFYMLPVSISIGYARPWKGNAGSDQSEIYFQLALGLGMFNSCDKTGLRHFLW